LTKYGDLLIYLYGKLTAWCYD